MKQELLEEILETGAIKIGQIIFFKMISLFNFYETNDLNFFFEWCDPELIEGDEQFKEQVKIMWDDINKILDENGSLNNNDMFTINEIRKKIEEGGFDTNFFMVFYSIKRQFNDSTYIGKVIVYKTFDECFNHILEDFKKLIIKKVV